MNLEKLAKIQNKVTKLKKEIKHAKKTDYAKGLTPLIDILPIVLSSIRTTTFSKQLFLALTATSININKETSSVGYLSSDFEKFSHLCVEGICKSSLPHVEEVERELFNRILTSSLSTFFGLVFRAYDEAIDNFKEENEGSLRAGQAEFFVELMIKAFFASELAQTTFKEMTLALSGEENYSSFPSLCLETLTMIALIIAFDYEDGIRADVLIADLKERLLNNFSAIELALNSYEQQERVTREELQPIRLFLGLEKNNLNQNQYSKFLKNLQELAGAYHINLSHLREDLHASRKLFSRLMEFEEKTESKETYITFVG